MVRGSGPRRPAPARRGLLAGVALALAVAAGAMGPACKTEHGQAPTGAARTPAPTVTIETAGRPLSFRVELAISRDEQARGLMYRQHLDADAGMLFVNDAPGPLVFWMKNTFIPLDMIFIGADRRIVGVVENAVPQTESPRRVNGLSQYVLEIGGGLASKLGIQAGQRVDFQGVPSP
jgi:uncharacterized membrane protein (UPF0127 family)